MIFRIAPRVLASAALVSAAALLSACDTAPTSPSATATLTPTGAIAPNATAGQINFTQVGQQVRVAGEVTGLAPGSEHGFHIHEHADCGDDGAAAGGHFNPAHSAHGKAGAPGSHAGELPSLHADANGVAHFSVELDSISLTEGQANTIVGRALVVHRDADDFTSQPAGNSGPRIACGLIVRQ